jgi:hypothetical protein
MRSASAAPTDGLAAAFLLAALVPALVFLAGGLIQ